LGSIHVKKDGRLHTLNEEATGAQVKQLLNLPPDSVLVNARNEQIGDFEEVGSKVKDGESIASYPSFKYWWEE